MDGSLSPSLLRSQSNSAPAQQTLAQPVRCSGIGVHSGAKASIELLPAESGSGITFIRTDVAAEKATIPALWNKVVDTRLCSVLGNDHGTTVATVEHLMAALAGCHIDNAIVRVSGPELPIMDGSSAAFVALIQAAGTVQQAAPRRAIKVLREVRVEENGKWASLSPAPLPSFAMEIDFASPVIGKQSLELTMVNGNFVHELANARTFSLKADADKMMALGFAKGGSLENAIVVDGDTVLNEGGLRHRDEFVRHKLLDSVGDLYLAGAPIMGAFRSARGGHALNNKLLHALFSNPANWAKT